MRIRTFAEFVFSVFIIISLIGTSAATGNTTINATVNTTVGNITTPILNPGSFLENEAGISAYTKSTTTINLDWAKNAFRTIETQTDKYIIGSVPIPGDFPETEDAHVYVSKSGWILAYYMRDIPASRIIQWKGYSGGSVTTTFLADAISSVATAAGISYSTPKYYNFKYPGANRMMMIIDWASGGGYDSYQFKIPGSFVINENSYSWRYGDDGGCQYPSASAWRHIDGSNPPTYGSYYIPGIHVVYGYYASILSPDEFHNVEMDSYCYGDTSINTILIYRVP